MTDIYDDLVARLYAAGDLEAADEIERLRQQLKDTNEAREDAVGSLMPLVIKVTGYKEALQFYANAENWRNTISLGHPQIDGMTSRIRNDAGVKAREALGVGNETD